MMGNEVKISVIMPSLNVVSFIEECIESVINQSFRDIEIICVDAGSTDGTLEILEEYAKNDSRIRIIHSEEKSYGYQMNLGIENAKGQYIGIVETDDFIDKKMYETLYNLTDNGSTDISKVNFYHYYDKTSQRIDGTKKFLPITKFTVFENADILNGHPSIWAAIYRKSFLEENNIRFIEAPGGGWVDNPFLFQTFLAANSITYLDEPFYYYRELNPDSSTNDLKDLTLPMKRMLNNLDVLEEFNCSDENILIALYIRIFWHIHDIIGRDSFYGQIKVIKYFYQVLSRLDEKIVINHFLPYDQKIYYKYVSPLNILKLQDSEINISQNELNQIISENEFLYSQISKLNSKNTALKEKHKKIKGKNRKLKENNLKLKKTNKKLNQDNKKLKRTNKQLNKNIKLIQDSKIYKLCSHLGIGIPKIETPKKDNNINLIKLPPKKQTRILFIPSDNNRTSGAFLSMANLINNLRNKYDLDIFVILPCQGQGQEVLDGLNISYMLIPSEDWVIPISKEKNSQLTKEIENKQNINKKAIKNIRKFIKMNDIDLIHINTTYSYVGAEAALQEKIPFVWHLREFLEEDQSNTLWNRETGNQLINKANKIIAISDSIYKKYENIFDENKLIKVYNGIDSKKFYKPNKNIFTNEKLIFIMVGGFEYYKGQIEFAEACSKLYSNGFKDFEVWFIGTGRKDVENKVKDIIASANIDNVKFLGYKNNVEDYYEKADISFTCAKSEAFGRTTVEAMLSGNLVIGANSAGTKELIEDNKTGILYTQGDSDELYEKMSFAINNKKEAEKIANNGRDFMFNNMTAEINADNIYEIYMEILNKN